MSLTETLASSTPEVDSDDLNTLGSTTSMTHPAIVSWLAGELSLSAFIAIMGEPNWGPIGREVYERTYSRIKEDGTNEHWAETVRRVVIGNLSYAPASTRHVDEDVDLFAHIYDFKFLPAGRHLWVTGTATSNFSRNCWVSGYSSRTSEHFRFLSSRLFEGGGVGSNYSFDLRAVTAPMVRSVGLVFTCREDHPDFAEIKAAAKGSFMSKTDIGASSFPTTEQITVADQREGWTDLYARIIDSGQGLDADGNPIANASSLGMNVIIVDVSDVREAGAPLRTFGGTASGPAPLISAAGTIALIVSKVAHQKRIIGALETMSIDHAIACSVVAGGSRRSARLAALRWDDPEIFDFIGCKADHADHWTANISVEIDAVFREAVADENHSMHDQAMSVLTAISVGMAANGEPGIIDTEVASADEPGSLRICNPCGEVFLATADYFGHDSAAGESCNLGSVNLAAYGQDIDGIHHAYRLLGRFLYRATLNLHHDTEAGIVEAKNRRLGAGFMGLQDWVLSHGYKLTEMSDSKMLLGKLRGFADVVQESAFDLADTLGLPRPVKVTAVAPTGSIAQMPGVTPSLQAVMARLFIRRVRYSKHSNELVNLADLGHHIEDDVYAADTKCVSFVVQDSILARHDEAMVEQANEIDFAQFMSLVAAVQGSFCGSGVGNAVSSTASLAPGTDPETVLAGILPVLGKVKGITAFPEVSRPQSPYEPLSRERFDAFVADGYPISFAGDSNSGDCGPAGCPVR